MLNYHIFHVGWNIPLFKQWIFFAPSRRLAFETTHLRNSLVGDLDHDATSHLRMAWSIGLHLRKQNIQRCSDSVGSRIYHYANDFWSVLQIKAIKEELRQDSLMLSKIPSWERSRIPSLQHLRSPWFSGFSRLVGHPDCQFPGNYSWMQGYAETQFIRGYWLRFQSCQSRELVSYQPQGITLCVWLMKESADLVAGGYPHKPGTTDY